MNMFARFDENPAMTLQVIKKTKRYGRTDARTDGRTDNVKTVYPTTNKVCGGYKNRLNIKIGRINGIEHNKGSKIYPQNQVILDWFIPSIPLKQKR